MEMVPGMTVQRVIAIVAILIVPALCAPALARARGTMRPKLWLVAAIIVCMVPVSAPWLSIGVGSPRTTCLVATVGTIGAIRVLGWLAHPRYADDRLRVILALSVWPALEVDDVLIRLPPFTQRIGEVAWRLAAGLASVAGSLALCAVGEKLRVSDRGLVLDSLFKTVEVYLLATGGNHLLIGAFGLAGYRVFDGFRYPILPRSVLLFWSRYDVCINRWLKRNIFRPMIRKGRSPATAVVVAFAFSGLGHEFIFVPAAPDLAGWQLGFFLLHGTGALAGAGIGRAYQGRTGRRLPSPIAVAGTIAFLLATTPVFLHCIDRIVDMHRDVGGLVVRILGW
jgi:hypothetical protein